MSDTSLWLLLGAVALIVAGVRLFDTSEKKRALKHMRRQPALNENQFGQRYFTAGQADIAARVRRILAAHIPVDLSQLHPDDKLVEEIRMDALDSMSTVEFVLEVEKEFGISIPDSAAEAMRTLRDVIDYIAAAKRGGST